MSAVARFGSTAQRHALKIGSQEYLANAFKYNTRIIRMTREEDLPGSLCAVADGAGKGRVVLVSGARTAFCRAKRGALKDMFPDELLAIVLRETCARAGVQADQVDDVVAGSVLQPGGGAAMVRIAALEAGLPLHCAVAAVNRQCASGLEAVAIIADRLRSGYIDIGIGCGVESMTYTDMKSAAPVVSRAAVQQSSTASRCAIPMGVTSDNVARVFRVSRGKQDGYSVESHRRARRAQVLGLFRREIVAVGHVVEDDGVRADCTKEGLACLKPVFSQAGTTTAGNSSQVSDGAAAILLTRETLAVSMGLHIMGVWRAYAVVGVEPALMGIGPAAAIPKALRFAGLSISDIDVFEINEAFASQLAYCIQHLGLPADRVNPYGGAIALGHPLGASGSRLILTIMHQLNERNLRLASIGQFYVLFILHFPGLE
jgi:acetyl-CoA acyltransferase 1